METVNVFGGSGFVGGHYARAYPDCIVNDRNDYVPKTNNILYFISTVDNYNVFTNPQLDIDTNLTTLIRVLENIPVDQRQHTVFNFISSWFVYGDVELPAKETSPCNPRGFYSITKRTAEQLLISYCETFNIKYRILRLGNVMGPYDHKASPRKNALTYILQQLKSHKRITVYDKGTMFRDIIDVEDCVYAIRLILTNGELNSIYNIGNGYPVRIIDLIDTARWLFNSSSPIDYIETPTFHKTVQTYSMVLDTTKLRALGYVPRRFLYDIIQRSVYGTPK